MLCRKVPDRTRIFHVSDPLSWKAMYLLLSEELKWFLLGISVFFCLLAIGILLWQTLWCCTHTPKSQDPDVYLQTRHSYTPNYKVEAPGCSRRLSVALQTFPEPRCSRERQEEAQPVQTEVQRTVQGSLLFSLYYDRVESQLVVTVLQAKGLQGQGPDQKLHPFVRVRLLWAGPAVEGRSLHHVQQEYQSRVVKDSHSPSFGDQFIFTLRQEKELAHHTVRMEVRDYDTFSRQGSLGEVRVPLGQINMTSYPFELLEDLHTPQKDLVGEVLLSLRLLPTCQRLEVGLLKIRTLPPTRHTQKVLYARVSVQCNHIQLRHQKTSSQPYVEVTVFNQVLHFSLPDPDIHQCSIVVSVYHSLAGRKSTKHLIGQANLGKGEASENQHWRQMMRSVRQPIAQWHQLLI